MRAIVITTLYGGSILLALLVGQGDFVILTVATFAAGLSTGSWWALALPLLVVPAGLVAADDGDTGPAGVVFLLASVPFYALFALGGVLLRKRASR